jgi:hypothetical protein
VKHLTLTKGDILAKVRNDPRLGWVLIVGEAQHLFEVHDEASYSGKSEASNTTEDEKVRPIWRVTLRVLN